MPFHHLLLLFSSRVKFRGFSSKIPDAVSPGSPIEPAKLTSTAQILQMWKSSPAVNKTTIGAGPVAAGIKTKIGGLSSMGSSLANIRKEMERNRKLQAERRSQVEAQFQERRALLNNVRDIRRDSTKPMDSKQTRQKVQSQDFATARSAGGNVNSMSHRVGTYTSNFSNLLSTEDLEAASIRTSERLRKPPKVSAARRMGAFSTPSAMRGLRLKPQLREKFAEGQRIRRGRVITILEGMTIRQLALAMRLHLTPLFQKLHAAGERCNSAKDVVDCDVAQLICEELGMIVRRKEDKRRDRLRSPTISSELLAKEGAPHRAPVVTVMGHVDHGKTSLLDALRGASVASREAGGITQGIAAFSVAMRAVSEGTGVVRPPGGKTIKEGSGRDLEEEARRSLEDMVNDSKQGGEVGGSPLSATRGRSKGKKAKAAKTAALLALEESSISSTPWVPSNVDVMTFIDTPGHALFSAMRKHGASATDIVVLVVDGKAGVQPQTLECVELITSSSVPCIIAVTKCDAVDPEEAKTRVASGLLELGFATEPYGGDAPLVPISARTGFGLTELKEAIAVQAELMELRARIKCLPEATVLDSRVLPGQGQVVDVIVTCGVLRVGDFVVAGNEMGRVKALFTDAVGASSLNKRISEAERVAATGGVKGEGSSPGTKVPPSKKCVPSPLPLKKIQLGEGGKSKENSGGGGNSTLSEAFKLTPVNEALPGTPVRILGLRGVVPAGSDLLGVEDESRGSAVLEGRARRVAAQEAMSIAATDAVVRKVERAEYQAKRDRKVAFTLASTRERQRNVFKRLAQPIPPRLQAQPWEIAIFQDARAGNVIGIASSGKSTRLQGGQQRDVAMSYAEASAGEGSTRAPIVSLLLRADSMGSLAALRDAVERIRSQTDAVTPRVITATVGDVTEKDISYAGEMKAHVVSYGARVPSEVQKQADKRKVSLLSGKVIYSLLDDLCSMLAGYLPAEMEEEVSAVAEAKAIFTLNVSPSSKVQVAVGCLVTEGTLLKSCLNFRLVRDGEVIHEMKELASLQLLQKKVESVKKGDECGLSFAGITDVKVGDKIQAITLKRKKLKLNINWD